MSKWKGHKFGSTVETDADCNQPEHGIRIPEDKLPLLNRSSAMNMQKLIPEAGPGYKGLLEVFHQLHCLVGLTLPVSDSALS
jgi:hypothetical protein